MSGGGTLSGRGQGGQSAQSNYGWAPPAASASGQSGFTPQYPQLYGGQWNQLSQLMAGPQYQPTTQPQSYANPPQQQYGNFNIQSLLNGLNQI